MSKRGRTCQAGVVNSRVDSVNMSAGHTMAKQPALSIRLLAGLGVEGDAHMGETVQHLSRVRRDPTQPNLRQVHLIHAELHDELRAKGFAIAPGAMGENVTTRGLDLLNLPTGTRLRLGDEALIEVTGLRNPCLQLNGVADGLLDSVVEHGDDGTLIRKAGVMAVVIAGGDVQAGDPILVQLPAHPHSSLEPV